MIYFRFNKIFCIIFKYPINIEWFIYKKFSNGIFLYSRVKFMNKVTRNRYDFERIESFFTRKNISRYFPIIQNVNFHLAFTYFTKRLQWKKKKRKDFYHHHNFNIYTKFPFFFSFLFSIEIFKKKYSSLRFTFSFLFFFFLSFFLYLSFFQNVSSYRIASTKVIRAIFMFLQFFILIQADKGEHVDYNSLSSSEALKLIHVLRMIVGLLGFIVLNSLRTVISDQ